MAIFRRGPPLTGALNSGGVARNRDPGRIAGYRWMTAGRASSSCDGRPCSLSRTDGDASVNLI